MISEDYLYQIWLYYNHVVRYNNDVNITDKEREEYSKTNNIDMNNNEISVKKKIEEISKKLSNTQIGLLKDLFLYEKKGLIKCIQLSDIDYFYNRIKVKQYKKYQLDKILLNNSEETFASTFIEIIIIICIIILFLFIIWVPYEI